VGALVYSIPIGVAISILIAIVVSSYRQTIRAYPQGGGAYIVTKDNLGTLPGLVSAAALLIDYVLTVAVSVAAGIAALTSAFPSLFGFRVLLGVVCIAGITTANLRGLRESGKLFAAPTYLFVVSFAGMLGYGFTRWILGWETPAPPSAEAMTVGPPERVDLPDPPRLRLGLHRAHRGGGGVGRRRRLQAERGQERPHRARLAGRDPHRAVHRASPSSPVTTT
jgi:amino acid transporter